MSNNDDEFKNVKQGLPPEDTTQKNSVNLILVFSVVGVITALIILIFDGAIKSGSKYGNIPDQMIMNGLLALLVGSIQTWVFKTKIKTRIPLFICFSLIGGLLAGLVGGLLIDSGVRTPIIIGGVNGALAGGFSSISQNKIMGNVKYGSIWFFYSMISWAVIFAAGWPIGWLPSSGLDLALAALFLMVASGISLAVFLNKTPQIEFS